MAALWEKLISELEGVEKKRECARSVAGQHGQDDKMEVVRETTEDGGEKSEGGKEISWTWGDSVGHIF